MFEKIAAALQKASRVGIFVHSNPDGDAAGSAYSLKLALRAMGKEAEVYLASDPDPAPLPLLSGREQTGLAMEDCDLLAALDCGDSKRLGEYEAFFLSRENTLAIDHHITHKAFARITVVRDVSSTCELMAGLYREMGLPLTPEIAGNLYVGLVSDTGNFKYSNITPETFRTAAELVAAGIDYGEISRRLFSVKTPEYYALMRLALDRLEFLENGRICVLRLDPEDFEKAGLEERDAVSIVTLPLSIAGVQAGVYIRKRGPKEYKVSLRSVGEIDVARVAEALGGGGHVRASGYTAETDTAEEAVAQVAAELQKQLIH